MKITYSDGIVDINVEENESYIHLRMKGKCIDREPDKYIIKLLEYLVEYSGEKNSQVVFDFRELKYMNSSNITPFIRVLEMAQQSQNHIGVLYDKGLDWQDKIFSALKIYQTKDKRVNIHGIKC